MTRKVEILVCGAGIAGISAAYHLARAGFKDIVIVDPLPPLSLTSDRSTECYRNWWPDPEMVALMNRSIDLMDALRLESGLRRALERESQPAWSNPSAAPEVAEAR